jgi:acetyltransferase
METDVQRVDMQSRRELHVLRDGTSIRFRPIRSNDARKWMELMKSCSKKTLYHRFQHGLKITHEMATRLCTVDFEKKFAIVAELEKPIADKLLGVARLVTNRNYETAEYAVLVADEWQGKGLGGLLTDCCLEIAKSLGVKRLSAITTHDNTRMIEIFRKRNFQIRYDVDSGVVMVDKDLSVRFHNDEDSLTEDKVT